MIRCNAYKSDTLTTYEVAQWQSSMRQQIEQMRRDNFWMPIDNVIGLAKWQYAMSQHCSQRIKDSHLPRYSWKKLPEVGYCYYVGLLVLDCPIVYQVREYGEIFLPEDMWHPHFDETTANMSNMSDPQPTSSSGRMKLFYFTITNEISYYGYTYSISIKPDGTFSTL